MVPKVMDMEGQLMLESDSTHALANPEVRLPNM